MSPHKQTSVDTWYSVLLKMNMISQQEPSLILWQVRKELRLRLATSCHVLHGCLGTWDHSSNAWRLKLRKKKVRSTTNSICCSANSASIISLAIHLRRLSVGMQHIGLPQCHSYSMNVVVRIGKQRLSMESVKDQISRFLLLHKTKRKLMVLSTM